MLVKMIAVLDHTLLWTKVIAPFAVRDNGKTRKTNPRAKTVLLVNTITNMDANRNPTVKFAMQEKNLVRKKQNVLAAPEVNLVQEAMGKFCARNVNKESIRMIPSKHFVFHVYPASMVLHWIAPVVNLAQSKCIKTRPEH